jgi:hypothetical protein
MTGQLRLAAVALACLMVAVMLPGCGSGKVRVTGKVLKNGQPLKVSKDVLVTLTFADPDKKDQTYSAKFDYDTGTYQVEVPPGKYHATCIVAEKGQPPLTAGKDAAKKVYDLTSGNQQVDIEVGGK